MPGGRPNKPLFELLRDESTGRRTAPIRPSPLARPEPVPEPELKPVPPRPAIDPDQDPGAEPVAESPPSFEPSPHRPRLLKISGETVQISRYTALVSCAVILALIFGIYLIAFNAGQQKGLKDIAGRTVLPDSPPATDPKANAIRPTEPLVQRPPAPEPAAKPPPAGSKTKAPAEAAKPVRPAVPFDDPTKPILTTAGAFDADPRAPGLNYLVLATRLTREDARQLVAFLGANGLETVGVPTNVESGGNTANNPGLYKVVTQTGITRDQFRNDDPLKGKLKADGERLGRLWQDQNKPVIIKDTYWENLKP